MCTNDAPRSDPKTTALIFESGKVVVTGAENGIRSHRTLSFLRARALSHPHSLELSTQRKRLSAARSGLPRSSSSWAFKRASRIFKCRIWSAAVLCRSHCDWRCWRLTTPFSHPMSPKCVYRFYSLCICRRKDVVDTRFLQLFPGLIFRMENPKVVLLIFVSGKIVLTGARNAHQMSQVCVCVCVCVCVLCEQLVVVSLMLLSNRHLKTSIRCCASTRAPSRRTRRQSKLLYVIC